MDGGVRKFENIIFSADKCPLNEALKRKENTKSILFVEAEGCEIDKNFNSIYEIKTIDTVFRPDNSPPYYLRTVTILD